MASTAIESPATFEKRYPYNPSDAVTTQTGGALKHPAAMAEWGDVLDDWVKRFKLVDRRLGRR